MEMETAVLLLTATGGWCVENDGLNDMYKESGTWSME
jgi:hypothetical protein